MNIGFSAGPDYDRYFKYWEHRDMLEAAPRAVKEAEARFAEVFGRRYPGMIEAVDCDDADVVLVTLGSMAGLVRERGGELRAQGVRAGMVRIRYLRPFPSVLVATALAGATAVGVLEKDVSFGAEGTVYHQRELRAAAGRRTRSHVQLHRRPGRRRHLGKRRWNGMFRSCSRRRRDGDARPAARVVLWGSTRQRTPSRKEVDSHGSSTPRT